MFIKENLTSLEIETLQAKFNEEQEYGGIPITKDNYEDLFESWFENLTQFDLDYYLE